MERKRKGKRNKKKEKLERGGEGEESQGITGRKMRGKRVDGGSKGETYK